MSPKFYRFLLIKLMGWRFVEGADFLPPKDKKAIFLFAPHTSFWDVVYGYMYIRALGVRMRVMVKKEAFVWPLSCIIKKMGGFPINRKNPASTMVSLVEVINASDVFYLVMCPEGTRKPVKNWKTGYHLIAKQTGIPVYLGYADFKKKELGYGKKIELTDDARADTLRIQEHYKQMNLTGKNPSNFVTG